MSSTTPETQSRRKQIVETYKYAKVADRRLGLWILLAFVVGAAVGAGLFWVLPPNSGVFNLVATIVGGLLFGIMSALIVFSRRAQRSAFKQLDGKPGAAAAALNMLRRGWSTTPAVAFTRQQDVVHRVVGRPGIVLVGEGNANRLRGLLATERRKYARVAAETPLHEVIVGDGDGQVPLPKLVRHVSKLPKGLKPADMTDILNRMKAIDASRSAVPLPKGPMPTSMKGLRGNMRGR
jgi:Domain of unknown function (DUF4191)